MMKNLATALGLLVIAAPLGSLARASNVVCTFKTPTRAYGASGGHGKLGLCGKFGRGGGRGYGATAPVQVVTEDVFRPCRGVARYDGSSPGCRGLGLFDHRPQHCFPNCYTGTPCSCCDHNLRQVRPGSLEHVMYAVLIKHAHRTAHPYPFAQSCPAP